MPEYGQHLKQVVAEEKSKEDNGDASAKSSARLGCCQQAKTPAKVVGPVAKSNCCQKSAPSIVVAEGSCCEVKAKDKQATVKPRAKIVISMFALGCRGSAGELASLPWAIVNETTSDAWMLEQLKSTLTVMDVQGPDQFYPPELPPPRIS